MRTKELKLSFEKKTDKLPLLANNCNSSIAEIRNQKGDISLIIQEREINTSSFFSSFNSSAYED